MIVKFLYEDIDVFLQLVVFVEEPLVIHFAFFVHVFSQQLVIQLLFLSHIGPPGTGFPVVK